jgi:hypothetical protein
MIVINNTVISDDVAERRFVCDLNKCKGACCVEGDLGAPLSEEELPIIENLLDKVLPYMSKDGIAAIEENGPYIKDYEDDYSTTTIKGRECAFAFYEKNGILKCAFEKAFEDGVIDFPKPISCHLYPIRIAKYDHYQAINYHQWHICSPACALGQELAVPVYQFLKKPLIRHFGEDWYAELDVKAKELIKNK